MDFSAYVFEFIMSHQQLRSYQDEVMAQSRIRHAGKARDLTSNHWLTRLMANNFNTMVLGHFSP